MVSMIVIVVTDVNIIVSIIMIVVTHYNCCWKEHDYDGGDRRHDSSEH